MSEVYVGELARQTINHAALIAATLVDPDRVLDDYQLESYVKKAYKLLKIAEDQFSENVCCDKGEK